MRYEIRKLASTTFQADATFTSTKPRRIEFGSRHCTLGNDVGSDRRVEGNLPHINCFLHRKTDRAGSLGERHLVQIEGLKQFCAEMFDIIERYVTWTVVSGDP